MEKLSILHLISARKYVGEAARVLDLACAQIEKRHGVVVMGRAKQSVVLESYHRGIPHSNAHMRSKFNPFKDYADVRHIRKLIKDLKVDIVHVHRSKEHWLAAWALSGIKRKIPLIRTRHVVTKIKPHLANKILYKKCTDGVICASKAVRAIVEKSLPFYDGPIKTIPGGIRMSHIKVGGDEAVAALKKHNHIDPKSTVVTVLARVDEVKGHIYLIQAMPEIVKKYPDTVFAFCFPRQSTYRNLLNDEVKRLQMQSHVRWISKQNTISPILNMTDIGVIASIGSEGWSRVAVEYMAAGVPVVSTNVGSLPEIVQEGETGFVVEPNNSEQLGAAICKLLEDVELRKKMGEAGLVESAQYNHERLADDVLEFYYQVLEAKGISV